MQLKLILVFEMSLILVYILPYKLKHMFYPYWYACLHFTEHFTTGKSETLNPVIKAKNILNRKKKTFYGRVRQSVPTESYEKSVSNMFSSFLSRNWKSIYSNFQAVVFLFYVDVEIL